MENLNEVRAGVLRQPGLVGGPLREELTDSYDTWLRELFASVAGVGDTGGIALVAVGGLGRREIAPYSDLDLVLLHRGSGFGTRQLATLADSIWYPIWDSKLGLDHSVRSPEEAIEVARSDIKAMLGMLDLRHIAGDTGVSGVLRQEIFDLWRTTATKRLPELMEISAARWAISGEGAFLLEPNLKDSEGGLRDAQSLRAFAAAQLIDVPPVAREAGALLLDVRGELHRRTGRSHDVLRLQEQAGVAEALGMDGDEAVLRSVNQACRTISRALDSASRRVLAAPKPRRRLKIGPFATPAAPERVGLAKGVVRQGGEVVLARDADPWADPILGLRAARAAAENDLPISPFALERLATESAPLPTPWPAEALDDFVAVLGAGPRGVPVMEALDQAGLLVNLIPEWDAVRFRAQHNAVHRYTVDRHLLEAAAQAAELTRSVARPDLLLLGALFHDIGKGYPERGDHSVVGAALTEKICARMGLSYGDGATVTALVRHHLLLPDTATRRDLEDAKTIGIVRDAVSDSAELLELLHALTIADAHATGPGAWSDWKAALVEELVRRTSSVLSGAHHPAPDPLDEHRVRLAEKGQVAVEIHGDQVVFAAPDALGVLSKAAGVLALHSLDVRSASIRTHGGMAVNSFVVDPRFGRMPDAAVVRTELGRALDGSLALSERLAAKEASYSRGGSSPARRPATVHWFDDEATDATVLELRADDAIGLLFRVTSALERCGVDVRSARVSSLGGSVVDAFYVTRPDGSLIPESERAAIEAAVLAA